MMRKLILVIQLLKNLGGWKIFLINYLTRKDFLGKQTVIVLIALKDIWIQILSIWTYKWKI